jgi:hypothetical protein
MRFDGGRAAGNSGKLAQKFTGNKGVNLCVGDEFAGIAASRIVRGASISEVVNFR